MAMATVASVVGRTVGAETGTFYKRNRRLRWSELRFGRITEGPFVCLARKTGGGLGLGSSQVELQQKQREEAEAEEDVILEGLNELANDALQVMLGKKRSKSMEDCLEDLEEAGEYLVKEGKLESARFVLVIKNMLDHKVISERNELEGPYKKAFDRIWGFVEDSGWALVPEKGMGVDLLDDELIPPVLF